MAARILGQPATPDQEAETGADDVRSKAEIMAYLRGSFTALHQSVATITSEDALSPVFLSRLSTARQIPVSSSRLMPSPLVRSLWANGGISAHERHRSSGEQEVDQQWPIPCHPTSLWHLDGKASSKS
jgi:hypothetical protein